MSNNAVLERSGEVALSTMLSERQTVLDSNIVALPEDICFTNAHVRAALNGATALGLPPEAREAEAAMVCLRSQTM